MLFTGEYNIVNDYCPTGVASIITEVDGRPITSPYNFTNFCEDFCRFTDEDRNRYYASDKYGGRQSAIQKKCTTYRCLNAGLIDGAAPIIVDNQHLATILFGQVLDFPIDRGEAIERARTLNIQNIDGYLLELEKIPRVPDSGILKATEVELLVARTIGTGK